MYGQEQVLQARTFARLIKDAFPVFQIAVWQLLAGVQTAATEKGGEEVWQALTAKVKHADLSCIRCTISYLPGTLARRYCSMQVAQ